MLPQYPRGVSNSSGLSVRLPPRCKVDGSGEGGLGAGSGPRGQRVGSGQLQPWETIPCKSSAETA